MRRPDWIHIIRSQAFANLWLKAHKAHGLRLAVVKMAGPDELHVAGNWRPAYKEGRNLDQQGGCAIKKLWQHSAREPAAAHPRAPSGRTSPVGVQRPLGDSSQRRSTTWVSGG